MSRPVTIEELRRVLETLRGPSDPATATRYDEALAGRERVRLKVYVEEVEA